MSNKTEKSAFELTPEPYGDGLVEVGVLVEVGGLVDLDKVGVVGVVGVLGSLLFSTNKRSMS